MGKNRKEQILSAINRAGFVSIQELMSRFCVSDETIRRDLKCMEVEGTVKRIRGGAVAVPQQTDEIVYQHRKNLLTEEKREIARLAAGLVHSGDTVIILSGTTTLALAEFLTEKKDLTVITNSVLLAAKLSNCPKIDTYCLGGRVRVGNYSLSGTIAEATVRLFNAKTLIIGIGGISYEHGLTDHHLEDATLVQTCAQHIEQVIVVADHSKFNVVAPFNSCEMSRVTHLVSSTLAPSFPHEYYQKFGIQVHQAPMPDALQQHGESPKDSGIQRRA